MRSLTPTITPRATLSSAAVLTIAGAALSVGLTLTGSSSARSTAGHRSQTACKPGVTGVHRYVVAAHNNGTSYTEFSNCVTPRHLMGSERYGGSGPSSGTLWTTNQIPVDNSRTTDTAKPGSNALLGGNSNLDLGV